MLIQIDEREHATILAALRYTQLKLNEEEWPWDYPENIANNNCTLTLFEHHEYDGLCERLNLHEPPVIGIGINTEGGNISSIFTDTGGVNFKCIVVDFDNDLDEDDPDVTRIDGDLCEVWLRDVGISPEDFSTYQEAYADVEAKQPPPDYEIPTRP